MGTNNDQEDEKEPQDGGDLEIPDDLNLDGDEDGEDNNEGENPEGQWQVWENIRDSWIKLLLDCPSCSRYENREELDDKTVFPPLLLTV